MTTNQLIYDVREAIRQIQDDSEISDRYIIYLWNLKRAKYLRNDLNNLQKTADNSVLQTMCMELERASANECNIEEDCGSIMRTKKPIPKPLELHLKSAITTIKPTTRISVPFNYVNKDRAVYSKYSTFGNAVYSFLDADMHIYLVSQSDVVKLIECITVTGIFEDPLSLKEFKTCCGCEIPKPCFDESTSEYPLQAHHVDSIRAEIVQALVGTLQLPEDKANDTDDSFQANSR
jgi:hypothetical protein